MLKIGNIGFVPGVLILVTISCSATYGDQGAALVHAAGAGDLKQVQELLQKGADVAAKYSDGNTALTLASQKGHTQIVELLQTHGAKE